MPIHYAGFWRRVVARWLDGVVLMLACWGLLLLLLGVVFWMQKLLGAPVQAPDSLTRQLVLGAIYLMICVPYFVVGHYRFGTTIGKRALGVYVRRASDPEQGITLPQSIARFFSQVLSAIPLCLGFALAGVHSRKQALHDLIAGTVCVVKS